MLDQNKFMELLKEITEVAHVQQDEITKEEVTNYFGDLEVTETQLEAVYQYLGDNGIKVPGFEHKKIVKEEENSEKEEAGEKQSVAHRLYMEELSCLENLTKEEKTKLFLAVRNGEEEAKLRLLEGYLPVVAELAESYKDKGMPVEDLIQEGNIGLLQALEQVAEIAKIEDADTFLIETVRRAMVEAVDIEIGESDWETSMLAKSNLVNEAVKYLAEDLGRVPTLQELAEYTRLPEKEIADLRQISLNAIEIGKGE